MSARFLEMLVFVASIFASSDVRAWCSATTASALSPACGACVTSGAPLAWSGRCLSVSVDARNAARAGLATDAFDAIVGRAFAAWTDVDCDGAANVLSVERTAPSVCGEAEFHEHGGNVNTIAFIDDWSNHDPPLSAAAYALTFVWFDSTTGEILDADILLNPGQGPYVECPGGGCTDAGATTPVDLESVLVHEAGHFFGLAHSEVEGSTMACSSDRGSTSNRSLDDDDRAGFCAKYALVDDGTRCDPTPRSGLDLDCEDDRPAAVSSGGCAVGPSGRSAGPFRFGPSLIALVAVCILITRTRRARVVTSFETLEIPWRPTMKHLRFSILVASLVISPFAAGCDEGGEAEQDAATTMDSGTDAGISGPSDAGADAHVDAGVLPDAGPNECAGAADGLRCATSCPANETCLCLVGSCVVSECGDGFVDPEIDETCDDGNATNTDACTNGCSRAECGDGVVRVGVEQCDDATASCSNECRFVPPTTCPNGVMNVGEQCDDGNLDAFDGCTNDCVASTCGDGLLTNPGGVEQCDDGNTTSGDGCSSTCSFDSCAACGRTVCSAFLPFGDVNLVADCYLQEGDALAGPREGDAKRALCAELVACVVSSGCADGSAPVTDCFCGQGVDASPSACAAPAGACAAQVRAAAETASVTSVLDRIVDPSFAVGDAMRFVQCEQYACASVCGF